MPAPASHTRTDAATAVERLARSLAHTGTGDPIALAYILRTLEAAARVEDYTEHDRGVSSQASITSAGCVASAPGYSAGRQP